MSLLFNECKCEALLYLKLPSRYYLPKALCLLENTVACLTQKAEF